MSGSDDWQDDAGAGHEDLGGRPEHDPTDENRALVQRLAAMKVSHEEIARNWIVPPISPNTLRKHYRVELDTGRDAINARLKAIVLRSAEAGSLRACFYLLDRTCPEFAPRMRLPSNEDMANIPAGTTITIRGGLPPQHDGGPDYPTRPNGHGGNGSAGSASTDDLEE